MIWLLALLTTTVVVVAGRAALRPSGAVVDHVVLFSFGFLFYWVLPVAAGLLRILADQPGLSLWYGTWDAAATSGALTGFLAFALVTYCAFIAGDRLGSRIRFMGDGDARELVHDPRLLRLFLLPILAITLLYAWQLRSQLFAGYEFIYGPGRGLRGTLSACSLVLLALALLRAAEAQRWPRALPGWRGLMTDPFVLAYAVSAVLVLSLGGRLYVVSAIIMALVYYTVYHRPLRLGRAVVIALTAMVLAGVAGSLRMGRAPTLLGIAINVAAEPLFTSFSLLHFLAEGQAPWVAAPRFLLGDFLNLVPSALFPGKAEYLLNPADHGYSIFAPLGALHSYVSLTINFGLVGTPAVIFLLGAGLAVLKRRRHVLARVTYSMLAGWLAFSLFRDAFSISVVKNMFEFAVLVPVLLIWSIHMMTVIAPRQSVPSPVTTAGGGSWT